MYFGCVHEWVFQVHDIYKTGDSYARGQYTVCLHPRCSHIYELSNGSLKKVQLETTSINQWVRDYPVFTEVFSGKLAILKDRDLKRGLSCFKIITWMLRRTTNVFYIKWPSNFYLTHSLAEGWMNRWLSNKELWKRSSLKDHINKISLFSSLYVVTQ